MVSKPKKAKSIKPITGHELLNFVTEAGEVKDMCTCQAFQSGTAFAPEEKPKPVGKCPYK